MSSRQRWLLGGLSLAVLCTALLVVFLVNRVDYSVLFSGLNQEDSAAVVTKLKELKIEHRISGDGQVIEVPTERLGEARLAVAGDGALQGSKVGFELFDKTSFGVTDFTQKINLRRALEGELARTISHLSEVRSARVHLVIPEEKLFKEDQEKAKASVVVGLRPRQTLSREKLLGISNLVASAVPGLAPEGVTIMDDAGGILTLDLHEDSSGLTGKRELEYRKNLESEVQRKILATLEPIVGPGRVRASVSLALAMDKVEEQSETYDPLKTVVGTSAKSEEVLPASGTLLGGVAGTRANTLPQVVPPSPTPAAGTPAAATQTTTLAGTRVKSQENLSYQVSRTLRKEVFNVGDIRRLSAAVVVDNKQYTTTGRNGARVVSTTAWKSWETQNMERLVKAAIGVDEKRGDQLSLVNIPFLSEPEEAPLTWWERYQGLLPTIIKYGIVLLIFLMLYLLLIRPIKKRVVQMFTVSVAHPEMVPLPAGAAAGVPGMAGVAGPGMPGMMAGMEGMPAAAVLPPSPEEVTIDEEAIQRELALQLKKSESSKATQLQKLIEQEFKKNPEKMANLVRSWLVE